LIKSESCEETITDDISSSNQGGHKDFDIGNISGCKDDTLPCKCQALAWKNEPKAWIQGFQALNFFFWLHSVPFALYNIIQCILSRDGEPYIEPTLHNTTIDVV